MISNVEKHYLWDLMLWLFLWLLSPSVLCLCRCDFCIFVNHKNTHSSMSAYMPLTKANYSVTPDNAVGKNTSMVAQGRGGVPHWTTMECTLLVYFILCLLDDRHFTMHSHIIRLFIPKTYSVRLELFMYLLLGRTILPDCRIVICTVSYANSIKYF